MDSCRYLRKPLPHNEIRDVRLLTGQLLRAMR